MKYQSFSAVCRMIQGKYTLGSFFYHRFLRSDSSRFRFFLSILFKRMELLTIYKSNSLRPIINDDLIYLGQMTHPDAVVRSQNGKETIYLAVTGYPYGDEQSENPCAYVSSDGIHFKSSGKNPVAACRSDLGRNHFSDVDLIDYDSEFLLYYRECRYYESPPKSVIWQISSKDFVHWDAPVEACQGEINEFLSPAVVKEDNLFFMYYVDFSETLGALYRRISENGIFLTSTPQPLQVLGLPPDRYLWHLDVVRDHDQLHGFFTLSRNEKGSEARLYYSHSNNGGLTWNIGKEISEWPPGVFDRIYRTTMVKFNGNSYLYVSVRTKKKTWYVYRLNGFDPSKYR